jgi:hypothetical protein
MLGHIDGSLGCLRVCRADQANKFTNACGRKLCCRHIGCRWIQISGRNRKLQENIVVVNNKNLTIGAAVTRSSGDNEVAPIKRMSGISNSYSLIIPKSNWGIKMCARTTLAARTTGCFWE